MRILVLGGVSYDTLIHLNELPETQSQTLFAERTIKGIGSTGTGKAIPLAKLGFDVTFHALIGDDSYGKDIQSILNKEHVNFIYDIDPKGTETHTNLMDDEGKRISIYTNSATFEPVINEQKINALIEQSDVVVMNIINYTRRFIPLVKALNKPLWVDIHDYDGQSIYHQDFIDSADFIFMSKDLMTNPCAFATLMIEQGKQAVIVTDGPRGIVGYYKEEMIQVPALKPEKQGDFNGAGDHVMSGYLFGYLNQYTKLECLKLGVIAATLCIESDTISNDEITSSRLLSIIK